MVGGLVVALTGSNPFTTYQAIFEGSGLQWLFPWVTGDDRAIAAINLQQTLIVTTPLILTGLAVAFAFRCGLFNIGGQGQYLVGTFVAAWIGSSFAGLPGVLHILVTIVLCCLAGAVWAGIAGILRATVGRQRGDLDDHAQLHRALGRASGCSRSAARCRATPSAPCRSPTTCCRPPACRCSGATPSCRGCTSGSSSRSPRSWSSGSCSTGP